MERNGLLPVGQILFRTLLPNICIKWGSSSPDFPYHLVPVSHVVSQIERQEQCRCSLLTKIKRFALFHSIILSSLIVLTPFKWLDKRLVQ